MTARLYACVLVLVLFAPSLHAVEFILSGQVVFEDGRIPVSSGTGPGISTLDPDTVVLKPARNIKIWVGDENGGAMGRTDSEGRFRFPVNWPAGTSFTLRMEVENRWVKLWADLDCVNERFVYRHDVRATAPTLPSSTLNIGIIRVAARNQFMEVGQCFGSTHTNPVSFAAALNVNEMIRLLFDDVQANRDPEEGDDLGQVWVEYCDNSWNSFNGLFNEIYLTCANYEDARGLDFGFIDETIGHEYGHFVVSEIGSADIRIDRKHFFCTEIDTTFSNDPEFAWSEGFPTYLAARITALQPDMNTQRRGLDATGVDRLCGYYGSDITWVDDDEERWIAVAAHITTILWDIADGLGSGLDEGRDLIDGAAIDGHRRILQLMDDELDSFWDAPDLRDFYQAWVEKYGFDTEDGKSLLDSLFNMAGIIPYADDCPICLSTPFPFVEPRPQPPPFTRPSNDDTDAGRPGPWMRSESRFNPSDQTLELDLAWSAAHNYYRSREGSASDPSAPGRWRFRRTQTIPIHVGLTNLGVPNMPTDFDVEDGGFEALSLRDARYRARLSDETPEWISLAFAEGEPSDVSRSLNPFDLTFDALQARAGRYDFTISVDFTWGNAEERHESRWTVPVRLEILDGIHDDPDRDGLSSIVEISQAQLSDDCLDPLIKDSDRDSLPDGLELRIGTDPCHPNSDGDALDDRTEYEYSQRGWTCYRPAHPDDNIAPEADYDGDGLSNAAEIRLWWEQRRRGDLSASNNPCDADSDGDGIEDGEDNCPVHPNADQADQDGDLIGDLCDDDRDGDGMPNTVDRAPDDPNQGGLSLGEAANRDAGLFFDLQIIRQGGLDRLLDLIAPAAPDIVPPGSGPEPRPMATTLARDPDAEALVILDADGTEITRILGSDLGLSPGSGFAAQALVIDDRDGDGLSELAVSAPRAANDAGEAEAGILFILSGRDHQPLLRLEGGMNARLGTTLLADGDRLLVGAPGVGDTAGEVIVLDGLDISRRWRAGKAGDRFGTTITLWSDGVVAVGAPGDDQARGTLYRLDLTQETASPTPLIHGDAPGERLGTATAPGPAGTLLVGVPGFRANPLQSAPAARFRPRNQDDAPAGAVIFIDDRGREQWRRMGAEGEELGTALVSLQGRGHAPLFLVGAPGADTEAGSDAGGAYLLRSQDGEVLEFIPGDTPGARQGQRLAIAPDFNGDGLPSIILGGDTNSRLLEWGRQRTKADGPNNGIGQIQVEDPRCFIATAAWGSSQSPYVELLRQFRDRYLMSHTPGRWLVETYYRLSPPLARWLAEHDGARTLVRLALWPLVGLAWLSLQPYGPPLILLLSALLILRVSRGFRIA